MRVVEPIVIAGSLLSSSSVSEPDTTIAGEAAWNNSHTYAAGDVAISTTSHRRFLSLQDGNLNKALPNYPSATANDWWEDNGPTNKWAMFDLTSNQATEGASPLEVSIAPGKRINALALVGLVGDSVTITGTSGGGTVYGPKTVAIRTRDVTDWYDYFFAEFETQGAVALFDIPPYTDLVLDISIARATGNPECTYVVVGTATTIGTAQFGVNLGADNYSQITRDIFGNATLVPRRSIPTISQTVIADVALTTKIQGLIDRLNATPALFSTADDSSEPFFQPLLIVGIYKSWPITFINAKKIQQQLELEQI